MQWYRAVVSRGPVCSLRKVISVTWDFTQTAKVRAVLISQGQVHIKVRPKPRRRYGDKIVSRATILEVWPYEPLFRQDAKILVTEVPIHCKAEQLTQATQLPPMSNFLKSPSPAISYPHTLDSEILHNQPIVSSYFSLL